MQAHPGMRIIIAGTENILWNMYNGSQKSMLITNCIFRWGGFAALLSNHPADRFRAKYKLQHVVRTHLGGNEDAYKCVPHCTLSCCISRRCIDPCWDVHPVLLAVRRVVQGMM